MQKRTLIIAAIVLLIGKGVYDNQVSHKPLTTEQAIRKFIRYEEELVSIAEFIVNESVWDRYYGRDYSVVYSEDESLPREIYAQMKLYFEKIAISRLATINKWTQGNYRYFGYEPQHNGCLFVFYNDYFADDGEGTDVYLLQGYLYISDDLFNEEHISLNYREFHKLAPKWYFVTSYLM